jgi:hypothetical protein
MAEYGYVENGITKTSKNGRRRKRRKNGAVATRKTATAKNGVRRKTSLTSVKAFAKRNGLVLKKAGSTGTAQNGKRKRRRSKNGLVTTRRAQNGMFGNTKNDVKRVGSVLLGAAGVKAVGKILVSFISPYTSMVNLGAYTQLLVDLGLALFAAPMIAKKVGGQAAADSARLGGLLVAGMDVVEIFFPSALAYSPFNNAPVVMAGNQPLLTPQAVSQLVNNTVTAQDAGKVGSAMRYLQGQRSRGGVPVMYERELI